MSWALSVVVIHRHYCYPPCGRRGPPLAREAIPVFLIIWWVSRSNRYDPFSFAKITLSSLSSKFFTTFLSRCFTAATYKFFFFLLSLMDGTIEKQCSSAFLKEISNTSQISTISVWNKKIYLCEIQKACEIRVRHWWNWFNRWDWCSQGAWGWTLTRHCKKDAQKEKNNSRRCIEIL